MSKLLFKMRYVPEDEAQEVRDLLGENDIEFFETFAGNWSISVPALWIRRDEQFEEARKIIEEYQIGRTARVKQRLLDQKVKGEELNVVKVFYKDPLRFIFSLVAIIVVLYISLRFFLFFWHRKSSSSKLKIICEFSA